MRKRVSRRRPSRSVPDDDDIQNQERDDEDRQRDHRGDLLITTDQDATQVEKAPEEQGLEDHTRRRNEESAGEGHRAQESVCSEEGEKIAPRPARRLSDRRRELGRQGPVRCAASRGQTTSTVCPHRHRPPHDQLLVVLRAWHWRDRPVAVRDRGTGFGGTTGLALDEGAQHLKGVVAAEATRSDDGVQHACGSVQRRERAPARRCER